MGISFVFGLIVGLAICTVSNYCLVQLRIRRGSEETGNAWNPGISTSIVATLEDCRILSPNSMPSDTKPPYGMALDEKSLYQGLELDSHPVPQKPIVLRTIAAFFAGVLVTLVAVVQYASWSGFHLTTGLSAFVPGTPEWHDYPVPSPTNAFPSAFPSE